MRLKRPQDFGAWEFFIGEDEEGGGTPSDGTLSGLKEKIRIPLQGYARTRSQIIIAVSSLFDSLAAQGLSKYKESAIEESKMMGIDYYSYLGKAIEHQICLRYGGGDLCSASGFGDRIHSVSKGIDSIIDKAPPVVQKIASTLIKALVDGKGNKQKGGNTGPSRVRLGGCGGCGGRRVFSQQGRNMGRAGRMQ